MKSDKVNLEHNYDVFNRSQETLEHDGLLFKKKKKVGEAYKLQYVCEHQWSDSTLLITLETHASAGWVAILDLEKGNSVFSTQVIDINPHNAVDQCILNMQQTLITLAQATQRLNAPWPDKDLPEEHLAPEQVDPNCP